MENTTEHSALLQELKRKVRRLFRDPTEDMLHLFAKDLTQVDPATQDPHQLKPLVQQAITAVLLEMVSLGLAEEFKRVETELEAEEVTIQGPPRSLEEELGAFEAICRIVREDGEDDRRITFKDTGAYFGIQSLACLCASTSWAGVIMPATRSRFRMARSRL